MSVIAVNSQADFDNFINSSIPTLVDFTASWCGPCKAVAPIVDSIARDFEGKVNCIKVDIDEATEITKKYGIRSVPTFIVFKNGQKINQSSGLTSRDNLIRLIGF